MEGKASHLMASNQVLGEWAVVGQNVNDLGICQLMASHDVLAVDFCSNHLVANVCVDMIGKVQHSGALQTPSG